MSQEIYNLKLHEWTNIRARWTHTDILRVPGGWIYYNKNANSGEKTGVFVPFNDEFQRK